MKRVRAGWRAAVLVCRKCSKKLDGGFGEKGRTPLARALRDAAGLGKGRKAEVGIVEVDCLKICPKRGVLVIDTADLQRWIIVTPDMPIDAIVERLRLGDVQHRGVTR